MAQETTVTASEPEEKPSAPFVKAFEAMAPGQTIDKASILACGDPGKRNWNVRGAVSALKKRKANPIEIRDVGEGYLRVDPDSSPRIHTRTYKFPLAPTPEQMRIFIHNWEARDEAYNAAIAFAREHARPGTKLYLPPAKKIRDHVTAYIKGRHWYTDESFKVHSHAWTNGVADAVLALKRWKKDYRPKDATHPHRWKKGRPRFRSVQTGSTWTAQAPRVKWDGDSLLKMPLFPKEGIRARRQLSGWIPREAKPREITIHYEHPYVWCSLTVQLEEPVRQHPREVTVGMDWGIRTMASCSNGQVFDIPDEIKAIDKQIDQLKKRMSRMEGPYGIDSGRNRDRTPKKDRKRRQPSRRWMLLDAKKKKLQRRRNAVLKHTQHYVSHVMTRRFGEVVVEEVSVQAIRPSGPKPKTRPINRAIGRMAPKRLQDMIAYKAERTGTVLTVVDDSRATQICSACGREKTGPEALTIRHRVYRCPCGHVEDRDTNAAKVLETMQQTDHARASQH